MFKKSLRTNKSGNIIGYLGGARFFDFGKDLSRSEIWHSVYKVVIDKNYTPDFKLEYKVIYFKWVNKESLVKFGFNSKKEAVGSIGLEFGYKFEDWSMEYTSFIERFDSVVDN